MLKKKSIILSSMVLLSAMFISVKMCSAMPVNDLTYLTDGINVDAYSYVYGTMDCIEYDMDEEGLALIENNAQGLFTSSVFDIESEMAWLSISYDIESSQYTPDSFTKLLLHLDGPDDSTSDNDFVDSSQYEKTITAEGSAKLEETDKKYGLTSAYFDGTGDYIYAADSSDWYFCNENFTIDFWLKLNDLNTNQYIMNHGTDWQGSSEDDLSIVYSPTYSKGIQFFARVSGAATGLVYESTTWDNDWHHVAIVRSGDTLKIYKDGIDVTSASTLLNNYCYVDHTSNLFIGKQNRAGYESYLNGQIDEFRVSKGIARWTDNFSPPDAYYYYGVSDVYVRSCDDSECSGEQWEQLEVSGDCMELDLDDNRFIQYKITLYTDFIELGPIVHDVTINYSNNNPDFTYLVDGAGVLSYGYKSGTLSNTEWDFSQDGLIIEDGFSDGVYTSNVFDVGQDKEWLDIMWNVDEYGAIQDAYTKLLLHLDGPDDSTSDSDFADSSQYEKTIIAEGSVKLEETEKKYGLTSAYFDGIGDYIYADDSSDWYFCNEDFTIDFWLKLNDLNANQYIMNHGTDWQAGSEDDLLIVYSPTYSKGIQFFARVSGAATGLVYESTTWDNDWHHVAIVRSWDTLKIYKDGIDVTSESTLLNNYCYADHTSNLFIGKQNRAGYESYLNGRIDEFRVSKGIARWTENFSPPDAYYYYGVSDVYVRSCDDSECSGEQWEELEVAGGYMELDLDDNRYIQYMMLLSSDTTVFSPVVYDVSIGYSD